MLEHWSNHGKFYICKLIQSFCPKIPLNPTNFFTWFWLLDYFQAYLRDQIDKEQMQKELEYGKIFHPRATDVLMGRGRNQQENQGNLYLTKNVLPYFKFTHVFLSSQASKIKWKASQIQNICFFDKYIVWNKLTFSSINNCMIQHYVKNGSVTFFALS